MSGRAHHTAGRTPALIALGLLAAAVTATILSTPWIFTNDGAQHLHSAELERTWGDAPAVEALLDHHPTPTANGFAALYRLFGGWLGPLGGTQAVLVLLALAWIGGVTALVLAVRPTELWVATLGAATALNWCFYMGFFNFLAGTSLGLLLLAFAVRTGLRRPGAVAAVAAALCAGVWVHLFATALTGLGLLILAVTAEAEGRRRRVMATLVAGAPAAVYAGAIAVVFAEDGGVMEAAWTPNALGEAHAFFVGGPWWRAAPVILIAACGVLAGAVRGWRGTLAPAERALLVIAVVFLALAGVTPFHLPRWQYFSPRFLPLGVLAALLLAPTEWLRRRAAALGPGILVLVSLTSLGWSYGYHQRMAGACHPILEAVAAPLETEGLRIALVLEEPDGALFPDPDGEIRDLQPLMHLDALMAAAHGGVAAGLWSTRSAIHPFRFREGVRETLPTAGPAVRLRQARATATDATAHRELTDSILSWYGSKAADTGDLVLWSHRDRDWFLARGFVAQTADRSLSVLRYQGCALSLGLDGIPPGAAVAIVEYGWYPLDAAHRSTRLPLAGTVGGRRIVPLDAPPCGPLWIRVEVHGDDGARWGCAGADAAGRVVMRNAPGRRGVVCALARATPSEDPGSSR